jgi:orotidine-5'-phosphate decarboxylase
MHTCGGSEMMRAAVSRAIEEAQSRGVRRPLLVGITVLTSENKTDTMNALVLERARLAKQSGLDGVVASSQEAASIRQEFGPDFVIVTPGIRLPGDSSGDQKRVASPFDAVINGSDYLVVGRPIVESSHPLESAWAVQRDVERARQNVSR